MRTACLARSVFVSLFLSISWQADAQVVASAEQRALAYLAREVPLWKTENGCYSCHNNGDGARVLYTAQRLGWDQSVAEAALGDTTAWLSDPKGWDSNRGAPEFSDKKLASIQFAAALEAAGAAGFASRDALVEAARSLLAHQEEDGSWQVDARGSIGSPITYGPALATYTARRVLKAAGDPSFSDAIEQADGWFVRSDPKNVLDAAATVLALADASSGAETKGTAVALIVDAQNGDGGWGPYPRSPSEPFDTALALLALDSLGDSHGEQVERGRTYLRETQLSPGGWPETTRPPGFQSYAQHISTSAWATLALLETAR